MPWLDDVVRAKKPSRLPTVLTQSEIAALHDQLDDPQMSLLVGLLYGSGLRLMEAVRLRVRMWSFRGARSWCVMEKVAGSGDDAAAPLSTR